MDGDILYIYVGCGTAEPFSRDEIIRQQRGQFPGQPTTTSKTGNPTRSMPNQAVVEAVGNERNGHTQRHTSSQSVHFLLPHFVHLMIDLMMDMDGDVIHVHSSTSYIYVMHKPVDPGSSVGTS